MFQVLKRPLVTEKVTGLKDLRQYVFEVEPRANKIQIRESIESRFNVKVQSIRTVRVKGKRKSQMSKKGLLVGKTSLRKKAYVTLKEGQEIDIFDTGVNE